MRMQTTIFGDIIRARMAREAIRGVPNHEDPSTLPVLVENIRSYINDFDSDVRGFGRQFHSSHGAGEVLLNIAATAVAALQCQRRIAGAQQDRPVEILLDPMDATAGELMGAMKALGAAYLKVAPQAADGTPLCAFLMVDGGPALAPTLDILDAVCSDESPVEVRCRVLKALNLLVGSEAAHG